VIDEGSSAGQSELRMDRWVDAPCALLLTDAGQKIVEVNRRLSEWTGFDSAALVGQPLGSLFTAGGRIYAETHFAPMLHLEGGVRELAVDLVCADGTRLPVLLNATRLDSPPGGAHVAMMAATDRRRYERDLLAARRAAEEATVQSVRMQTRLTLLAKASAALSSHLDVEGALGDLASVLVEQWSQSCVIHIRDEHAPVGRDEFRLIAAEHADSTRTGEIHTMTSIQPADPAIGSGILAVTNSGQPQIVPTLDAATILVVPIVAGGRVLGVVLAARTTLDIPFNDDDLADAADLGARTGLAVETMRVRASEHETSVAIQQAMLSSAPLPNDTGIDIVERYRPAAHHAEIGGDWYDTIVRPDGTHVLVIGDVIGHGNDAAAAMGQLRFIIRTLAYTSTDPPNVLLSRASEAAHGLGVVTLATALLVMVEPGNGPRNLTWSNAGHPPPVLVSRDKSATGRETTQLQATPELLLGLREEPRRRCHSTIIHPGDMLFLYTDGLIERQGEDLNISIAKLLAVVSDLAGGPLDQVADSILDEMLDPAVGNADDVALLLAQFQ
jgi:PAS domain S-box-containing protein